MHYDEAFPPDTIDEQVDKFTSVSSHESAPPEIKVIQRLAAFYEAEQHSTEQVWKRLEPYLAEEDAAAQPVSRAMAIVHGSHKKMRPSMQPTLRSAQWTTGSSLFAQVAAVVFAVVLVGSLLLVFHMAQASRTGARPNQTTQIAGQQVSPPGIYISRSDGVYRLNIQTRKVIWHTHVAGQSLFAGAPVVIGNTVYIITDGPVSALNAQTGALRWLHTFPGRTMDPYIDDGLLYFNLLWGNALYAVNPATGSITATYTPKQGEWNSPIVVDGVLYYTAISAGSVNSTLYAVQLSGEKLLWQHDLSNVRLFGPISISVQNGILYVQISHEGLIDVFSAHTGAKLWQSPALAKGVRIVAITDAMIYACTFDGELLAFDTHTHALVWHQSLNTFYIRVASSRLYIEYGPYSGQLAALNATTGKLLWQRSKSNGLSLDGILNGIVYGDSWPNDGKDGTIYAFSASNGSQLWTMSTGVPNVQWGGMVVV
jgi:outer membrane protein assembly factor BamB